MVGVHVGDDTVLGRFIFGLLVGHFGWYIAGVTICGIDVYSRCIGSTYRAGVYVQSSLQHPMRILGSWADGGW